MCIRLRKSADKHNGCGPHFFGRVDALNGPDNAFEDPCVRHDEDYTTGGREWHRWIADFRLFINLLKAASRQRWYNALAGFLLAPVYLVAVLCLGWLTFEYKK